jgi:hypothetical protein
MAMGLLGAFAEAVRESSAESTGDDLQAAGVRDPARRMLRDLAARLAKRFALEVSGTKATITDATRPKAILAASPGADLVLHLRASSWGFAPTSTDAYAIGYEGTLTLIDARSESVVAEGICTFKPAGTSDSPSYKELLANNAAVLREMLDAITEACLEDYGGRVLGVIP